MSIKFFSSEDIDDLISQVNAFIKTVNYNNIKWHESTPSLYFVSVEYYK